jgi:ribosomal protein L5
MPKIIKAKKAVAGFKLRKGADIAILVTIRNKNILKTITETIIYTKMEENGKGKILNRNIRFGLKTVPILKDAGVSIDLLIEGKVENNRANYYKSQILIP